MIGEQPLFLVQTCPYDVVVYDIEIKKCIPDRNAEPNPQYQYCAGWHDHADMGIAVLAAFDTREGVTRVFMDDNLTEFAHLIKGRTVAGFNIEGFDNKLLAAHGIHPERSYDLLSELRAAVREPRGYTPGKTRPGRTLDDCLRANGMPLKTLHGAQAPIDWQNGNIGKVVDYCVQDVMRELALLTRVPKIIDPATRGWVELAMPPRFANQAPLEDDVLHEVARMESEGGPA